MMQSNKIKYCIPMRTKKECFYLIFFNWLTVKYWTSCLTELWTWGLILCGVVHACVYARVGGYSTFTFFVSEYVFFLNTSLFSLRGGGQKLTPMYPLANMSFSLLPVKVIAFGKQIKRYIDHGVNKSFKKEEKKTAVCQLVMIKDVYMFLSLLYVSFMSFYLLNRMKMMDNLIQHTTKWYEIKAAPNDW